MNKDDFNGFLRNISDYFGLEKYITPQRFSKWFAIVEHLPAEALEYITNRFYEEKETIPRNIPKWMREYFRQWLNSNPDKIARNFTSTQCDDCKSDGLIYFKANDGNNYVARCGSCRNWEQYFNHGNIAGIPRIMRTYEIYEQGGRIL